MQRSPFSALPAPHQLFSPSASPSRSMRSASHSRTRHSGSASTTTSEPPTLLFDADPADSPHHRSHSRGRSPAPDDDADGLSVPLHTFTTSGASSRGASPYPASEVEFETDRLLGRSDTGELRIGEGSSADGAGGWLRDGKLGRWLWGSQRGWVVYVVVLMVAYGLASLALLIMNRFILWTGVYKFGYPITTTFVELAVTQMMLYISASLTRSFSRSLHALGLHAVIAPRAKPSKGKQRAQRSLREFARQTLRGGGDGIFGFRLAEAKVVVPLAVVYAAKLILSNLSFAYTQLQIYQVSRTPTLLVTLALTHFFFRSHALSVTALSSCITMVLALAAVSLRPGTRFAPEGFLAGIFSTLFVAAYPILLAKTHRTVVETPTALAGLLRGDAYSARAAREHGVMMDGDGKDETRAAWKLLHYVNVLSMALVFFCALVSGEIRDISRNCYFLDVAFFWLMMLGAGVAAWATFVTGFLLLRATSPLTMNVVGYPRATVQTLLLMGFRLPTWSWVGVWTCWGSAVWYFVGRRRELGVVISGVPEDGEEYRRGRTRSVVEHMMG